jgi:hypothetical protein
MSNDKNTFKARVLDKQRSWRRDNLPNIKGKGKRGGKSYFRILPWSNRWNNFWPGIRPGSPIRDLESYLGDQIQPHTGMHHLMSSWALCANMYFPFGTDNVRDLLARFLRNKVDSRIVRVTAVELEYAHPDDDLKPDALLGEPPGMRGSGQTSPDVAFLVELEDGSEGLVLTEVKYTEENFYTCSGYKELDAKTRHMIECFDLEKALSDPVRNCVAKRKRESKQGRKLDRDYLVVLKEPMTRAKAWETMDRCPGAHYGYQLLRQQALAEALAKSGLYSLVVSSLAYPEENRELMTCMRTRRYRGKVWKGIDDVASKWAGLFDGRAPFVAWTHEEWMDWVRSTEIKPYWTRDWLHYVEVRYR